jgi:hypothetical protein
VENVGLRQKHAPPGLCPGRHNVIRSPRAQQLGYSLTVSRRVHCLHRIEKLLRKAPFLHPVVLAAIGWRVHLRRIPNAEAERLLENSAPAASHARCPCCGLNPSRCWHPMYPAIRTDRQHSTEMAIAGPLIDKPDQRSVG